MVLHGWGTSMEVMRPITQHLASRGWRVLSLDFPGFGQSPPPPKAWGVPEYADATAQLLERLDVRRPLLLGHSFGGRVIIYLTGALSFSAFRLVLVGAAGIKPPPGKASRKTRLFQGGKGPALPAARLPARAGAREAAQPLRLGGLPRRKGRHARMPCQIHQSGFGALSAGH